MWRGVSWTRVAAFAVVMVVGCAKSAGPVATTAETTVAEPSGEPVPERVNRELLLWRVTKGEASSTLMGTCHMPIPLPDALPDLSALTEARVLYGEIDVANIDPTRAIKVMWDESATNAQDLGRERFAEISRAVPALPAPMLDRFKPWVIVSTMAINNATPAEMDLSTPVLDVAVLAAGQQAGVPFVPIETLEGQAAMMEGLGITLTDVPDDEDKARDAETSAGMIQLCLRGDLAVQEKLTAEFDALNAAMFEARNLAWYPVLEPELTKGGVFVAVGAGHMLGPTGLLAQAEAEGFEVERLSGNVGVLPLPDRSDEEDDEEVMLLDEVTLTNLNTGMGEALCVAEGPVRQCFEPDQATCEATVGVAFGQCVDQQGYTEAVAFQTLTELQSQQLGGCAVSGLIARAMATGEVGDAPICAQMVPGLTASASAAEGE